MKTLTCSSCGRPRPHVAEQSPMRIGDAVVLLTSYRCTACENLTWDV